MTLVQIAFIALCLITAASGLSLPFFIASIKRDVQSIAHGIRRIREY